MHSLSSVITTHDPILENLTRKFLFAQKIDPELLPKPPAPNNAYSRTYCPVCLTQYVIEKGAYNDCGGVPLKMLWLVCAGGLREQPDKQKPTSLFLYEAEYNVLTFHFVVGIVPTPVASCKTNAVSAIPIER